MKNVMTENNSRNFRSTIKGFVAGMLIITAIAGGSALADYEYGTAPNKDGIPTLQTNVVETTNISEHGAYIAKDSDGNTIYGDGYNRTVGIRYSAVEYKVEKEGEYGAGSYTVDVGNGSAEAGVTTGAYTVIDKDGKVSNCVGVKAEASAKASLAEAKAEGYLGDKDNNVKGDVDVTALSAGANAGAEIGMCNGQPMVRGEVGAEANLAEAKGSVGGTIAGVEAKVGGSLKVGVGATAKAEYKDGKFNMEIGASLGLGGSVSVSVDVDAIADKAEDGADAVYRYFNGYEQNPLAGKAYEKSVDENGNLVKTRSMQKGIFTESEYKSEGVHLHTTSASF